MDQLIFQGYLQADSHGAPCHPPHAADVSGILLDKESSSVDLGGRAEGRRGVVRICIEEKSHSTFLSQPPQLPAPPQNLTQWNEPRPRL